MDLKIYSKVQVHKKLNYSNLSICDLLFHPCSYLSYLFWFNWEKGNFFDSNVVYCGILFIV